MLVEPDPIKVIGGLLEVYNIEPWESNEGDNYLSLAGDADKVFILPSRIVQAEDFVVMDKCKNFQGEFVKRDCCKMTVSYNECFYLPYHWSEIAKVLESYGAV